MLRLRNYQLLENGDSALTLLIDAPVGEELTRKIISIQQALKQRFAGLIIDSIPSYQSITFLFDPMSISSQDFRFRINQRLKQSIAETVYTSKLIHIPVCYEAAYAPDLSSVASHCQLSEKQVVAIHSEQNYLVHMLGFLPGFLYLGGLDSRIHCPRMATPQFRVPSGSVGIGGNQTGVYPITSPGGWRIIGRTPLTFFNLNQSPPTIASPLDRVKFHAINAQEFCRLSSAVATAVEDSH